MNEHDRPTLPIPPSMIGVNPLEPTIGLPIEAFFRDENGEPFSFSLGAGVTSERLEEEIKEEARRELGPGPWPLNQETRIKLERASSRVFRRYVPKWRFVIDAMLRSGAIEGHFERTDLLTPEEKEAERRDRAQKKICRLIEENIERPTDQLEELVRILLQLFDDTGRP